MIERANTRVESSFVDILRSNAEKDPGRRALVFVDEADREVCRGELDEATRSAAHALLDLAEPGDRILILLEPGQSYIVTFLACLYAGLVAVPQYPPLSSRGGAAVLTTARDAGTKVAVASAAIRAIVEHSHPELSALVPIWRTPDELERARAGGGELPSVLPDQLALLQYTSGSTGTPKGVMVRHSNLVYNSMMIQRATGSDADSVAVSWLPPYHDMGLIGGILQPLFVGFTGVHLSPLTFLRQPKSWLSAISRFNGTVSPAPDFAYRESARRAGEFAGRDFDLSSWRHAMVGAEPVRKRTLELFAETFAPQGFDPTSFHPCYGLAEATLLVTGGNNGSEGLVGFEADRDRLEQGVAVPVGPGAPGVFLASSGRPQGLDRVVIVDQLGEQARVGTVGEVLVSGTTVAAGYWNRAELTAEVFSAQVPAYPGESFLRTGDLGFLDADGRLYVTGRTKDLIIVRGRNIHPEDLEATAETAHSQIRPSRTAAFDDNDEEGVVVVCETRGADGAQANEIAESVACAVAAAHGLERPTVVVVPAGQIPRTTSGKVRRSACRQRWADGELTALAQWFPAAAPLGDGRDLDRLLASVLGAPGGRVRGDLPLAAAGLDSLKAVRLSAALESQWRASPTLVELMSGMTAMDLGRWLQTVGDRDTPPAPSEPADPTLPTPTQEWLWTLDKIGAGLAYTVPGAVRIRGPMDVQLLSRAFAELQEQNPSLRSVFSPDDGGRLAVSAVTEIVALDIVELPGADPESALAVIEDHWEEPFDVGRGPLVRGVLVRCSPTDHTLGFIVHHIVADGWSLAVLLNELGIIYERLATGSSGPYPGLPVLRSPCSSSEDDGFWRENLRGAYATTLPVDRRPVKRRWIGRSYPVSLSSGMADRLRGYAAERGVTAHAVLLAAFVAVLSRWSDQDDIVVGVPTARRGGADALRSLGVLVNTLPVRVDAVGDPSFTELVQRAAASTLQARMHEGVDFERILELARVKDLVSPRAPLIRVCFAWQELPFESWPTGALTVTAQLLPPPGAQFEVTLTLLPRADGSITGHAVYSEDLFDQATIAGLVEALLAVLGGGMTTDDPLSALPLREPSQDDIPAEVMDARSRSMPVGAVGQLTVVGSCGGETVHLARLRPDGGVIDLGPLAQAVRVRGARVTPQRVEALLIEHPGVRTAQVVITGSGSQAEVTAEVTVRGGEHVDGDEIRTFLAGTLPGAVLPDRVVLLAEKYERTAAEPFNLVSLSSASLAVETTPSDEIERTLAEIWAEVLQVSKVPVDVTLLDIGGHSLHAARVVTRVEARLGHKMSVSDLLNNGATIQSGARAIRNARREAEIVEVSELDRLADELAGLPDEEIDVLLRPDHPYRRPFSD